MGWQGRARPVLPGRRHVRPRHEHHQEGSALYINRIEYALCVCSPIQNVICNFSGRSNIFMNNRNIVHILFFFCFFICTIWYRFIVSSLDECKTLFLFLHDKQKGSQGITSIENIHGYIFLRSICDRQISSHRFQSYERELTLPPPTPSCGVTVTRHFFLQLTCSLKSSFFSFKSVLFFSAVLALARSTRRARSSPSSTRS